MKKIISACSVVCLLASSAHSQQPNLSRQQALGISFFMNDFVTPDRIRSTSLNQVISDKKFAKFSQMQPGLAVSYFRGLGNHVDVAATLGGSFVKYPMPNK